jgi:hypothetical protein
MRPLTLALFALGALAGCTGREAAPQTGEAPGSLVRVDLSYTHMAGASDLRFDAQAHFVRYRSLDPAGVPTLLGFVDFEGVPLDTCRVSDGTADLDEALATGGAVAGQRLTAEVTLLDAGRIEVRGPSDRAPLRPTHYPELVPFVSGVVYAGDEVHPVALGLGQSYQVVGEGGEEVGPFSSLVSAPKTFPSLTLEPLRRGAELELHWALEPEATEAVLLEVKWAARAGSRTVRCRVRDDGDFAVPRDLFEFMPPQSALVSATVSATRLTRGPLAAPGAGRGEFTFELRDIATLQVAP